MKKSFCKLLMGLKPQYGRRLREQRAIIKEAYAEAAVKTSLQGRLHLR